MPSNYSVYNKSDKSILSLITLFKGNAIDLVRRAVCLHSILWPADFDFFCMCMGHDHSSRSLKVKVDTKMSMLPEYLLCRPVVLIDGRSSIGFVTSLAAS